MKSLFITLFSLFSFTLLFHSCLTNEKQKVIDITAKDFTFQVVDEVPSGWTTFTFNNSGHAPHFFLLNKIPDSISFETYHKEVTKPFDIVFDSIKAGKSKGDAINMLVATIPSWYFTSVKQMGGTGIIDMGRVCQITLKLEPGTYVMECYIKEKGVFHTALGMIKPITVTKDVSNSEPPESNMDISITNTMYETNGEIKPGINTIAVHFKEQPNDGLGNDVHLIKVNNENDIDSAMNWLDWMNVNGLEPPAPVEFLGGSQEMPVGNTSYFTVDLKPGNYAWIAESTAASGLVKKFTIK